MLLTIDVGNTNITFGMFEGKTLITTFRMTTKQLRTSDEYGIDILEMIERNQISGKEVEHVIIASVVPDVMHSLNSGIIKYFNITPVIVGPGIRTGIRVVTENPKQIGADRIVDAAGAFAAKLPKIEIQKPESILAQETISSMQAGLIYGQIGQTEYIVRHMIAESGYANVKTVATGGLGRIIANETECIDIYDPNLTLSGLRLIFEKQR